MSKKVVDLTTRDSELVLTTGNDEVDSTPQENEVEDQSQRQEEEERLDRQVQIEDQEQFHMIDDPEQMREMHALFAQHAKDALIILELFLDEQEKEKLIREALHERSRRTNPERYTDEEAMPDDAYS